MRSAFRSAGILFLTATTLLLATPGAWAARLPDWAKAIAESAPPAPEGVPPYPARVLLSETRYEVQEDGSVRIRRRFATQALSTRADDEVGTGVFGFSDTQKVTSTKAWHVPPGERASRSWGAPADVTLDSSFLSDSKVRVVKVRDIKKGSLVFYEFEAIDKPRILPIAEVFYEGAPVADDRVQIVTPQGWTVQYAWLRVKGPDPVVEGNERTWEMRDLPAPEDEDLGLDPGKRAPFLAVNPVPPDGVKIEPASFRDWASFSAWYEALVKGKDDVTPSIAAAAKQATADAGTDLFAKVKAAGKYVRDKVRYVDVELGIGGMQPRPASDTLSNLYGDCKDKGTLFRAFLSEEGVPSYPVLINSALPETVPEDVPVWGFNHFIVAVPIPEGLEVPKTFAPAVADGGDLGLLLIVDTTDERAAIGSLSASLGGKRGLVVAGGRGRVVELPSGDPSVHTLVRRLEVVIRPDRSVVVKRSSRYTGSFAAIARDHYSSSSVDRRKGVEQRILQIWPDATVDDYSAEYETDDGAYVETVDFKLRPLTGASGAAKVEIFPGASEDLDRVPLGRRKTPVDYRFARTIRYEVSLSGVPQAASLPEPQSAAGDGWSVKTTYARDGDKVEATWEVVLSRTHWDLDSFAGLKKFWSAMASAASWVLSLPS